MYLNAFTDFFSNNLWVRMILDGYFLLVIGIIVFNFVLKNKTALNLTIVNAIFILIYFISKTIDLTVSKNVFLYLSLVTPIFIFVIVTPDLRRILKSKGKNDIKHEILSSSNQDTKNAIVDAVLYLGGRKIGALITIEKNMSLDQYSEKAIQLNSDVSKELLINIFTPLTPLHDGGVIIRGNKIRCAGAYYVLAQKADLDKTTGSRHRAGIGISEVSDSLTIIVSEETGNVSLAIEGVLIRANEREKLLEYLDMFLK